MANLPKIRAFADSDERICSESESLPLFPPVPCHRDSTGRTPTPPEPANDRVGIARLAATSPLAESKRGAEYFLLPARSILNRCDSERVPFAWTVNPYRGCEFGCKYCYARYTHEYMELDGGEFERKIFVKQDAGPMAFRELRSSAVRGEHIAIGTATDPYQPAEREFGATRAILEEMVELDGLSVSITTKSDQVLRDIDILKRINERSRLSVNLSVTTPRRGLARLLEPRAPRPDLRIGAVRMLRQAGIAAGILVMPVLPGLTDRKEDLELLARAARDADACWFAASVLFLMPASRKQFFPFLEQKFPRLTRRYQEWYAKAGYAPESYRAEIAERFAHLRRKYGLETRPEPADPKCAPAEGQLSLAL
ncbi:MAG TPA: radical SAM protein [Candidatus Acidoferrales bacterium]|nr:radical SAM protein [Candidatus Acidoferrales bacterium]